MMISTLKIWLNAVLIFLSATILINGVCYIPYRILLEEDLGNIGVAIFLFFNTMISKRMAEDYMKKHYVLEVVNEKEI